MKKQLSCLALAALLAVGLAATAHAQANAGQNFSAVTLIRFTRSAPTVSPPVMAYQDSITLAVKDTVRTNNINTDGWDWSAVNVAGATVPPRAVALVAFWVPTNYASCSAGDSIYYLLEPSFDGGQTYISTASSSIAGFPTVAVGNFAIQRGGTLSDGVTVAAGAHNGTCYTGYLIADYDTSPTSALQSYAVWGLRDFRLKIIGDTTANGAIGAIKGAVYPISTKTFR